MSRLANDALGKFDQILRTAKWLRFRNKMHLQSEPHFAACIFPRYLCHFDASTAYLVGLDPEALYMPSP